MSGYIETEQVMKAAGMTDRKEFMRRIVNDQTHGLRYAAATRLYELRVSFDDIASITGHETAAMVRKYAKNKRAAKIAIGKLDAATDAQKKRTEVTNRLSKSDKWSFGEERQFRLKAAVFLGFGMVGAVGLEPTTR